MTTDNTQVGLKKLCEAFIDGDISAGQFKRVVRIWHNKQVEAVLDRLVHHFKVLRVEHYNVNVDLEIVLEKLEAERNKLKDTL